MAARAFAKVILFGEHAVVHGRLGIAAALDIGATADATRTEGVSTAHVRPWGRSVRADGTEDIARAFAAVLEAVGGSGSVSVELDVEVPGGVGLGCSAAIAVATARATASARGVLLDADRAATCANAWDRVFHGNPSGIDAAAAAHGGVLSFRRGHGPESIVPGGVVELAVVSTGHAVPTKDMVESVGRQLAAQPELVERTFDRIDDVARRGARAIESANWEEAGQLMDLNQQLLASLNVSTDKLEHACGVARAAGALGAKLTGGGGGGCAIALAPGRADAVLEAWRGAGLHGFAARIGAPAPAPALPRDLR